MHIPAIDPALKGWLEVLPWLIAVVAAPVAIFRWLAERRSDREQRAEEHRRWLTERGSDREQRAEDLRWRRAQAAKSIMDEMMLDEGAELAMRMLDFPGSCFEIDGQPVEMHERTYLAALRVSTEECTAIDQWVCENFDALLWYFALLGHYIDTGLVLEKDVRFPTEYYVRKMQQNMGAFIDYMRENGLTGALAYLRSYHGWQEHAAEPESVRAGGAASVLTAGAVTGSREVAVPAQ